MPEEEALPLYIELIALYQGPFLAGFNVGEWGNEYRNWCEISFLEIVKLVGRQLLKRGQPNKALPIIKQGLSQDNFREDLHRLMLEVYDELGRYDLLNQHYYELGKIFEQENLPIEPETERVYRELVRRASTR
jgi:two-component SAPR family response regulator